jgi:CRISPR-associated protein Cas4
MILSIVSIYVMVQARRRFSIPSGKGFYQDLGSKGKILRSESYGISGKPDMIKRKRHKLIPYEYKSGNSDSPREGHVFQMAAYFLILEENFPRFSVPYGILKYNNTSFVIRNEKRMRERLLYVVEEMRSQYAEPTRNHKSRVRCLRCSFNEICEQSLIK